MSEDRYLILGSSGLLGRAICKEFQDENCVDFEDAVIRSKEMLDITNHAAVRQLVESIQPTVVVNAANFGNDLSSTQYKSESWQVNAVAVDNLVKTCAYFGVPLVQFSTGDVFGGRTDSRKPFVETDVAQPFNWHGVTKMAGEHAVFGLGQCMCPEFFNRRFRFWLIRTSMLFEHPRQSSESLIYWLANRLQTVAGEVPVPTDVVRSFTYAPHLAKAVIWLLTHHREIPSGCYHIANGGHASLHTLASRLVSNLPACRGAVQACTRDSKANLGRTSTPYLPGFAALNTDKWHEISPVQMPHWQDAVGEFCRAMIT